MNSIELARRFMAGRLVAPSGPLVPSHAELTRKSLLLFAESVVLKLRRPRVVDGVDQTESAVRYAMTARERWLGRKLNRDVYLPDCVLRPDYESDDVVLHAGFVEGEPVVLMRRLRDAHRADHLLLEGLEPGAVSRMLEQAMRQLATFHIEQEAHVGPPFGDASRAGRRFKAALTTAGPALQPGEHERLTRETEGWLEAITPTLAHRISERRMRSLHGELRLEHIFLPLETEPSLLAFIDPNDGPDADRALDTAEEVMGLALELELVAGREVADRAVDVYAGVTTDISLRKVARFYKRLASLRRAAEAVVESADSEADPYHARERARYFVDIALRV